MGWKPRGPNSWCSLVMVREVRWQCGQLVIRNSISTTLPLRLDSRVCLPEGSTIRNSGDRRGIGRIAIPAAPRARKIAKETSFCILTPSGLLPLFVDPFDFLFCRSGGILWTQVAFDYAEKHLGDDTTIEDLHGLRCRIPRVTDIPGPFQRILQLLVLR